MKKMKLTKDYVMCAIVIAFTILFFFGEKVLAFYSLTDKPIVITCAIISTLFLALAFYSSLKCEDVFCGMMIALIGYKMMPITINYLYSRSVDAYIIYLLLGIFTKLAFAAAIYILYKRQEEPPAIKAMPLIAIMFVVPVFNESATALANAFLVKTGSMLPGYITQYACYAAASLIIICFGYLATKESMRLVACFEFVALAIRALNTMGSIGVRIIGNYHISRSFYGWLLLYFVLFVICIVALSLKNKEPEETVQVKAAENA